MPAKVAFAMFAEAIVFALLLFGAAGTVYWPACWAFLALVFGPAAVLTAITARRDPALLAERMKVRFQQRQPLWDRIFLVVIGVLFLAWLVSMGLDARRYQWSHVPDWLRGIGAAAMLASWWICARVFDANTFLAPVVKIQAERGQTVISTGPYAIVRHPFYVGAILLLASSALLLGSWIGVAGAGAIAIGIAIRIPGEEHELRRHLAGYNDYAARVRYRLIPFIW
jgi:protein-S-isoprenylcysteine O-methyltransferase Ste14